MPPNLGLPVYAAWTQASEAAADLEARLAAMAININGYLDVARFAGASAADKAIAALASIDPTGMFTGKSIILDFSRLTGTQLLDRDIYDTAVNAYQRPRIAWLWGSAKYRVTASQHFGTDCSHHFASALFIMEDGTGARVTGLSCFRPRVPGCLAAVTAGSSTITPSAGAGALIQSYVRIGSPVGVFGQISSAVGGGKDAGTITGAHTIGQLTLVVDATLYGGLPGSGYLRSGTGEIVRYTAKAGANTLTLAARGYGGTTATAYAGGETIERCTYDAYYITAVDAATGAWTLDRNLDLTATAIDTLVGSLDVAFLGSGVLDGNLDPAVDDAANPFGIFAYMVRRLRVGEGLTFQNWDHGGIMAQMCQDSRFEGFYSNNSRAALSLGSNFWLFTRCYRNLVRAHFQGGYQAVHIDDRTTSPSLWDGPSVGNVVEILSARNMVRIADVSSCHNNSVTVYSMEGYTVAGVVLERSTQWVTNVDPGGNTIDVRSFVRGAGAPPEVNSTCTTDVSGNTIIVRQPGAVLSGPRAGMSVSTARGQRLYGNVAVNIAIDVSLGDYFIVTATTNPFTFNFPLNGYLGAEFTVELINASGGALTPALTGSFHSPGAMPAIANGLKRLFRFRNNGAQYVVVSFSPADIT